MNAKEFAYGIVEQLRRAGFEAVWAGGCVRDQLLGIDPRDYDVATNARPEQVQEIFGKRRTLAIGVAFGVIVVLGPKRETQVEVATFRRDDAYSDGRHPDSVSFSSAREDAQRRDFTINGLFFDPLSNEVIDYVDGQADLHRKIIRAIGKPQDRFREDKLRMLRAVRFTATFGFQLDPVTLDAIQQHAGDLTQVSAERVAAELRRMLMHHNRHDAIALLRESHLLTQLIPELSPLLDCDDSEQWNCLLRSLHRLTIALCRIANPTWSETEQFVTSMACLIRPVSTHAAAICQRLKLSNDESSGIQWLIENETSIHEACKTSWPQVQRRLIHPLGPQLVTFAAATSSDSMPMSGLDFCNDKLQLSRDELNPQPLITGDDLVAHGFTPGRSFKRILETVRDAQLMGELNTIEDSLRLAEQLAKDDAE